MEDKEMLLHFLVEQQRMISALCRNDLLLIDTILSGPNVREGPVSAAATVRAILYSVDSLGGKQEPGDNCCNIPFTLIDPRKGEWKAHAWAIAWLHQQSRSVHRHSVSPLPGGHVPS